MPIYGNEDILFQLRSTLLQAGNAGENTGSYAVLRTENDILPPGHGGPPPC